MPCKHFGCLDLLLLGELRMLIFSWKLVEGSVNSRSLFIVTSEFLRVLISWSLSVTIVLVWGSLGLLIRSLITIGPSEIIVEQRGFRVSFTCENVVGTYFLSGYLLTNFALVREFLDLTCFFGKLMVSWRLKLGGLVTFLSFGKYAFGLKTRLFLSGLSDNTTDYVTLFFWILFLLNLGLISYPSYFLLSSSSLLAYLPCDSIVDYLI